MRKFNLYFILATLFLFTHGVCLAASAGVTVDQVTKTEVSKQTHSTIKIAYPVIKMGSSTEKLNAAIHQAVDDMIATFKKNLADTPSQTPISGMPLTVDSNALDVDYKVFHATPDFISLRFSIYTNFYGSAHPLTVYQSLNYDLRQKKIVSLADVFKGNDYLSLLASFSKKALTEQLSKAASTPTEPDAQGLAPTPENFQIWNFTDNGLLLTFPPYQVAAYVFGPQEVTIPYAEINDKLKIQYH